MSLNKVGDLVAGVDPGRALMLAEEGLEICRGLVAAQPENLYVLRDLAVSLNRVGDLVRGVDPGRALGLYEEGLEICRGLVEARPGSFRALWDLGVAAARCAGLVTDPADPAQVSGLWREAAISFRSALNIQPDHSQLGRLSFASALDYAKTDPPDRDEWLAYAAELAERFGFDSSGDS